MLFRSWENQTTTACRWTGATLQRLGPDGGEMLGSTWLRGWSLDAKVIVGNSGDLPGSEDRPYRWTAVGGITEVPLPAGAVWGEAMLPNSDGSVMVMHAYTEVGDVNSPQAYRWTPTGTASLGTLGNRTAVAAMAIKIGRAHV